MPPFFLFLSCPSCSLVRQFLHRPADNCVNPSSGKPNVLTEERNYGITRFNTRFNQWEK